MMMLADPLTARELEEESPVETAVGAEVDVLDDGRLAQPGLAQAAGEPFVLAAGRFAVDEQPEPILAAEFAGVGSVLQLDKPALMSLPPLAYEYAEWKRCRVGLDYHVEIAKHYYSVPHQLMRQEVEARITVATIEIFHRGKRVASHRRSLRPHRPSTVPEHMPSAHRRYRDWTHERIRHEAQAIGPDAAVLVDVILRSRPHPEQGFRSCVGILRLVKRYGAERVDAACARALVLGTRSYTSVAAILKNRRERAPSGAAELPLLIHENIRGPDYYH